MVSSIGKAKPGRGQSERTNKHAYSVPALINKIIYEGDIILEILDARFIEKTRNTEIEKLVKNLGKKLIYILNKSDLVDIRQVKTNVEIENLKPHLFFSNKDRKSASILKRMIKIEAHKLGKDAVNFGVIGYPNSGKSSLINLLIGRKVERTSSEAGYTKGLQKVKITKGIYLIDTPGIIPAYEKAKTNRELVARHSQIGAVTWDKASNPDMIVFRIMREYPNVIEKHYGINTNGNSEELIEILGKKLHYLVKGGEVDEMRTAKHILRDWQEGKKREKG